MMTPTNVAASRRSALQSLIFGLAAAALAPPTHAQQCPGQWLPENAGFNNSINSMAVTADGDLIVGGIFTAIGQTPVNRVARWDGVTWSPIGQGIEADGQVWALTVLPNGHIIVGGNFFFMTAGQTIHGIAEWDGVAWRPMASGLSGTTWALTVLNGEVIAGGNYFEPDKVRRWDAAAQVWRPVGSLSFDSSVYSLAVLQNGDLVAGGNFSGVGIEPANTIRRWDGTAWHAMQWGPFGGLIHSLLVTPSGDLYAGGQFSAAGTSSARGVARRNGSDWAALGAGVDDRVHAMTLMQNGDLVVGGRFVTAGGAPASAIARWNGAAWSPLGSGLGGTMPYVLSLAGLPDGDIAVGGTFNTAGGNATPYFARWRDATPCYANCDCSVIVPTLNVADYICFMNKYAALDPYANCDASTLAPTLNVADFICFMNKYAAGCP